MKLYCVQYFIIGSILTLSFRFRVNRSFFFLSSYNVTALYRTTYILSQYKPWSGGRVGGKKGGRETRTVWWERWKMSKEVWKDGALWLGWTNSAAVQNIKLQRQIWALPLHAFTTVCECLQQWKWFCAHGGDHVRGCPHCIYSVKKINLKYWPMRFHGTFRRWKESNITMCVAAFVPSKVLWQRSKKIAVKYLNKWSQLHEKHLKFLFEMMML